MAQAGALALHALGRLPMFRHVARPQLVELACAALAREVRSGEAVARRGERLPGLMVVSYGLVKLSLKGDGERVLRLVGGGETFGEAALFLEQPLPVDVGAVADSALLVVPAAPLFALFEGEPGFARALVASLCQRLQMLVADFEATTVHDARERLAAYLGALAAAGTSAQLPASKMVIASRLGMSKETLSRLLRAFREEGLIAVRRREIRLLDPQRLAAAARTAPEKGVRTLFPTPQQKGS